MSRVHAHCAKKNVVEVVIASNNYYKSNMITKRSMLEQIRTSELKSSDSKQASQARTITIAMGARVRLTENIATDLGLANGTIGTIHDILIPDPSVIQRSSLYSRRIFVPPTVKEKRPLILFRPDEPTRELANHVFKGFGFDIPAGVVPIDMTRSELDIDYFDSLNTFRTIKITRYQFPIALGYAITDYKCQGQTYTTGVIDLAPVSGRSDPNSAYVMLSRFRSLHGLLIFSDFPIKVFNEKLPSPLVHELDRLERLNFLNGVTPPIPAFQDLGVSIPGTMTTMSNPHAFQASSDQSILLPELFVDPTRHSTA